MYSVSPEPTFPPRKRAIRDDVRKSRTALKLVMPINRQIGFWQSSVARLISAAERTRATEQEGSSYLPEIDRLERDVRVHRQALTEDVSSLPADIRDNSRIADTWRALDSVLAGLERARSVLR